MYKRQKITGGFRKSNGNEIYCTIRSIVETCKSKNIQVFESARFFRTHRPFFSRCISGGVQPEG
nr:hypothetical protein [uncultured Anaerocolumna sp.]